MYWNRHKKLKNQWNNGNPSDCVILCEVVPRKNIKLDFLQIFVKSVPRNELSRTKFHGFVVKRPMFWHFSWHSLRECSHFWHTCASWHGVQCWWRNFSTWLHEKTICHFRIVENGFFCEAATKDMLPNGDMNYYKESRAHLVGNWQACKYF